MLACAMSGKDRKDGGGGKWTRPFSSLRARRAMLAGLSRRQGVRPGWVN
jgi:hypothetical protein